jgi:hypothetical protein
MRTTQDQMGFDLTAAPVGSETDRNSFQEAIRSNVQLQLALDPQTDKEELDREVNRHFYQGAITRLTIGDYDVWVSRALWVSSTIIGRCTVGYWAVRCDTGAVVFVKDVWRTDVSDVELEDDILKGLEKKGVRYIPTVSRREDVTQKGPSMSLITRSGF